MGRGVDYSPPDVQFMRDGMAGGANLSLLARCRGWSYSILEKLVRRFKHGESGTRKQRASRVHADIVDRMEEDIQTNPRQSWADLAVKCECSCDTIRHKLSDRGLPHIQALQDAEVQDGRTGKTRVRQKVQPLRLDKIVFSDEKMFRFCESGLSAQTCRVHTKVSRKRDLKPSMAALEGDKFMKGIMVAAGATLDGGVWEPHFVPSTVKMASPEYHRLLAHC